MASFGGSVKLTGESEYRKALKEITMNLKEVSSELKLANTQFNSGDKTVNETKTSYTNMNNTIQEQKEKINSLRIALTEAEKEYGSNNEKVKTFKTQLNNAEAQLVQMESATNKSNKELKEMKNGFDEAGQSTITFGDLLKANVLGDMITSGIKAIGSAIKEVGVAFLNVGKQALDSYADYEQLVGGVETLFKDSAGIVENYANNAYKTAGLSANQYMETVTSFSASLLQSLNGDTAKSAEVADMAITDMSDNANKMGTDMYMIQNAYQGFAKQNYTMLDNLKLGYGGTKEEMQRLLKDAQEVTGIKYDISNLNDVYQAIHVIQGELGITGTTAKEASTTIQGSVSAMKSAWRNMLTGIATGDAGNIGNLVNNLTDSIITAGQNVLPRIQEIINGVVAALPQIIVKINENLPMILNSGAEIFQTLIEGINSVIPNISYTAFYIIDQLITSIISNLPQILEMGINLLTELINGISQTLPDLIPIAIDSIMTMVEALLNNIDLIIDSGIQLIFALADGLIEAIPILVEKAPEIIQSLIGAILRNFPKIVQAGGELIGKLVAGIVGSFWKLLEVAPQLIASIVDGIKQGWREITNVGKYLVEGLWSGISGMASWVADKVKSFATNIVGNIKEALGIHSPSTVLRDEVGKFMADGIGIGFSNEMDKVTNQMQNSIPKEFDVNSSIINSNNNNNRFNLTESLIEAFKEFKPKIILNEKEIGEFAFEYGNIKYGRYYN